MPNAILCHLYDQIKHIFTQNDALRTKGKYGKLLSPLPMSKARVSQSYECFILCVRCTCRADALPSSSAWRPH